MLNVEHPDNGGLSSSGTLKARHLLLIGLVAVAVIVTVMYLSRQRRVEEVGPAPTEDVIDVPEGTRTATLYFAARDTETLVTETRLVAIGRDFLEQVSQVVTALLEGPEDGGVSTVPDGTTLLNSFYDGDAATLYLDFSDEIVAGHPGGSSAEYYTIAAIIRTVSENFPEVRAVQILVEGLQVGTIAGHIDAYGPFLVSEWR